MYNIIGHDAVTEICDVIALFQAPDPLGRTSGTVTVTAASGLLILWEGLVELLL